MVSLIVYLHCVSLANGKTVSGVFKSDAARENNGQYITRFLFHGKSADDTTLVIPLKVRNVS